MTVGKKLYCGNLGFDVGPCDLEQLFSEFGGVVNTEVIQDRATGRSKGFGFVELGSDAEAASAIKRLDGTDYKGRPIKVNEARPCEPQRGGGYGGGGRRGERY